MIFSNYSYIFVLAVIATVRHCASLPVYHLIIIRIMSATDMIQGFVTDILEPLITDAVSKAVKASLNPEEKYCTVQQAMEMLHCSLASVYRYKDQGKFSFQKIGGKTLILREELNAAVQERKEWKLKAR